MDFSHSWANRGNVLGFPEIMKDHTSLRLQRAKNEAEGFRAQCSEHPAQEVPLPTKQPYPSTYSSHRQRKFTTRTTLGFQCAVLHPTVVNPDVLAVWLVPSMTLYVQSLSAPLNPT